MTTTGRRSSGAPLGTQAYPRVNGLNLVRLGLAATVVFAHAFYIVGAGIGPVIHGDNLGGWAVYGFFAVSGYLVTHSRLTRPLGDYLVHRVARLFPGYWVCLLVMVVVVAPLGFWATNGTLSGYWSTQTQPLNYLFANSMLRVSAFDIAGGPAGVPFPGVWNGSIWTLYYEFVCYLVIAAVLSVALLRRRGALVVAGLWIVSAVLYWGWGRGVAETFGGNPELAQLLKLLPVFLGGALLRLARVRLHVWGVLASTVVLLLLVRVLDTGAPQLCAPLIAYALLWVGAVLPSPAWFRRHDISYGTYVYAFPVQQLIVVLGLGGGVWINVGVALLITLPLAVASWFLVERPVMRRVRKPLPAPAAGSEPAAGSRVPPDAARL